MIAAGINPAALNTRFPLAAKSVERSSDVLFDQDNKGPNTAGDGQQQTGQIDHLNGIGAAFAFFAAWPATSGTSSSLRPVPTRAEVCACWKRP
jgi:hypothetical protein